MISLSEVKQIHSIVIGRFGGSDGLRDSSLLESAINRPFQTFDQQELYPDPVEKAAAIFESVIVNHPFVDGNKRTAYVLMRLLLLKSGLDISATEDEKYDFVISAASGQQKFDQIRDWIRIHLSR